MYSDWKAQALFDIAEATRDLPDDADLKRRRSALRAAAQDFHGGTSWGRKVWSRECRKYLERHGLPPRTVADALAVSSKQARKLAASDITFPFRPSPIGGADTGEMG